MASYKVLSTALLATTLLLGSFATSAEAFTRNRQTRSSRGFDETGIESIFTLVTVDGNGDLILDGNPDEGSGYFAGAVLDYVTFDSGITSSVLTGTENPFAASPIENIDTFSNFDSLIAAIESTGVNATNIGPLDLKAQELGSGIQYSFIDSDSSTSVLDITIPEGSVSLNGLGDLSNFSEAERGRLVNDLPFIVENFDWRFLPDGESAQSFIAETVFVEEVTDSVSTPEPNAFAGVAILSAIGFGLRKSSKRLNNSATPKFSS